MKSIFITGTDTGIGKTIVCACLAKFLALKGLNVGIQKWVSTGNKNFSEDMEFCLKMLGKKKEELPNAPFVAPYIFGFPYSPHLAAELERKEVDIKKIKESYYISSETSEVLLVEGVGGTMVPLRKDYLLIDLLKELSLPVLVVTRTKLGTINHTLLTIEALRNRKIEILGVIFNSLEPENDIVVEDNIKIIAQIGGIETFGLLPKATLEEVFKAFQPIGEKLLKKIKAE